MVRIWLLFYILLFAKCWAQGLPNDCENFVQVCGNYDISLDVSGAGVQEIGANACYSEENNSLWLRFTVKESGTLGFTLAPQSSAIQEDYDFWIFGPNVLCESLGTAIRCSTTNPSAAGQANNHTGLNETSTDVSEGPGPDGDSFLQWLEVVEGETYFLVIDRPHGNSAFELTWSGTAILDNPLENYTVYQLEPIFVCDPENDGEEEYDLTYWSDNFVDSMTNIEVTYYETESNAIAGYNALPTPAILHHGQYFAKIMHVHSKCFEIVPFMVNMYSFQINSLEVVDNKKIIVHTNINTSEPVYYRLDGQEWQTSNIFDNVENGLHTVEIKFGNCISDTQFTYILKTHNVITPNGDGYNDVWYFEGLENFSGSQIRIFDRYGKLIFESNGEKPFLWDGKYNGRELPSGDYWYFINLPDGRSQSGNITLIQAN